jgi:glucose-6-phosphate-specific signal transduction histidine kinase
MQRLAEYPGPALTVELSHADGRFAVRVVDPAPSITAGELRAALSGDLERLAALGGDVELVAELSGALVLVASLPERLEPLVDVLREGRA